jgi:predicted  nucleic acid-binding Zn-ribbon protein
VKPELAQLIALQQADNRIKQLQANLNAIPQRRADIEREFELRASEIKALETRRDEARHKRRQLEHEIEDNKTKAARAERNLMAAKRTEDYTAAIREADTARKATTKLEEQALEQMATIEETEAALATHAPEIERLRGALKQNLTAFEKLIESERVEIISRQESRAEILKNIPVSALRIYERLSTRLRDGVAVAEVRNGACAACFMSVRPQAMSEIRKAEVITTCEHCTRILYIVPEA